MPGTHMKETCTYKWDLHTSKETCMYQKRRIHRHSISCVPIQQRPDRHTKKSYTQKRPKTCEKRCVCQKRRIYRHSISYVPIRQRPNRHIKKPYIHKKDLKHVQRDLFISKETYTHAFNFIFAYPADTQGDLFITHKGDLYISKATYIYQKRRTSIKRDVHTSKETYIYPKRPVHIKSDLYIGTKHHLSLFGWGQVDKCTYKRDVHTSKDTYMYQKRPACIKRDLYISKETCTYQKRHLNRHSSWYVYRHQTSCVPIRLRPGRHMKGTCTYNRDVHRSKETYIDQKRRT